MRVKFKLPGVLSVLHVTGVVLAIALLQAGRARGLIFILLNLVDVVETI